jgi:ATP-dependent helicase HrpB
MLEVAAWGTAIDDLAFIDRPTRQSLDQAGELLRMLGALNDDGRITTSGRRLVSMPVHPRLAHMISESPATDQPLACAIAALLDDRDVVRGRPDDVPTDIAWRIGAAVGEVHDDRIDRRGVARWRERADDIARRVGVHIDWSSIDPAHAGRVLLRTYPDRLANRRQPGQFQLRNGSAAWCRPTDSLAAEAFVVAADLDGDRKNARIRLAASVEETDIMEAIADDVVEERVVVYDKERRDLLERFTRRVDRMRLTEVTKRPSPGPATMAALVEHVRSTRLASLPWSKGTVELRARVAFLRREIGEPWPDWSDKAMLTTIDHWLEPYLAGITSMNELASLDLSMLLRSQLPWPEGSRLDELAPTSIELPSGRALRIDYSSGVKEGTAPVVPVRVQDLFGVKNHPSLADGRVKLVLQLLSPADRPIQITSDLPGFWAGTWSEVRKEMAGRYPKHNWPTDPANADPKRMKDR